MPNLEHAAVHFIETYKYVGLYLSLALGILGLPIPDETLMTFAGFKVYQGRLNFILTVLVSVSGSLTGMSLSYLIGNKIGIPFLHKYGKYLHLTPERLDKAEKLFRKYRGKAIITGYFVPGLRHVTAYFAGISELGYGVFLSHAAVGAGVWVLVFVSLGRWVGRDWKLYAPLIHRYLWLLLIAALLVLLIYAWAKRKGLKNHPEQDE